MTAPLAYSGMRLDALLERMAAPQLIRIATRFAPGDDVRQMQKARQATEAALSSRQSLNALVAGLSPLELFVLDRLRQGGGVADGWGLIVAARARELKPAGRSAPVELYRHYRPASFDGAELLWPLLADGLLMPMTLPNPFLEGYGRGLESGSPLLCADDRLLAALPTRYTPPPVRLKVTAAADRVPPAATAQSVLLKLTAVLDALRREGGLTLTKTGEHNRNSFKRLQKRLTALPDAGFWLEVCQVGGLLEVQGDVLLPGAAAAQLGGQEAEWVQRWLTQVYPALGTDLEPGGLLLAHLGPLRSSLLALLAQVPPTTVAEFSAAFERCTPDVLRLPSWRGQGLQWRPWLREALSGPLTELGLATVSGEGEDAVVTGAGLSAVAPTPGPAWVVQPNFELVVYPAQLTQGAARLLSAAEVTRFDAHSATYRLSRESVYTALEAGLGLDVLLRGLEQHSATGLPAAVRSTLQGWAERRERLVLHTGATLLEFPDPAARDAWQSRHGGTPVGATLLLPDAGAALPAKLPTLRYDAAPRRALKVGADGLLRVQGELDFPGRSLLTAHAEAVPGGYRLRTGEPLPASATRELEARVQGSLPPLLRLQLGRWSGSEPAPALGHATLLQHPQAAALLEHPPLKPLLTGLLAPGLLLVQPGQQQAVERELTALGLAPGGTFTARAQQTAVLAPDYEFPEDTRRKRALLEEAIAAGRRVRLMYQEETYHGWYGETRPGKTRQRVLVPLEVYRQGSTPYLRAEGADDPEEEQIRVGYILGIAVV